MRRTNVAVPARSSAAIVIPKGSPRGPCATSCGTSYRASFSSSNARMRARSRLISSCNAPSASCRCSPTRSKSQFKPARCRTGSSARCFSSHSARTSSSRPGLVERAKRRSHLCARLGTIGRGRPSSTKSQLRKRRTATRKSCNAERSAASARRACAASTRASRPSATTRAPRWASAVSRSDTAESGQHHRRAHAPCAGHPSTPNE